MTRIRPSYRIGLDKYRELRDKAKCAGQVRPVNDENKSKVHEEVINEIRIIKDVLYTCWFQEEMSSSQGYSIFRRSGPEKSSVEILTLIQSYYLQNGVYCGFKYSMTLCGRIGESDYSIIASDVEATLVSKQVDIQYFIDELDEYFGIQAAKLIL